MSVAEEDSSDLPARLHLATPDDRGIILQELMSAHPEGRLVLAGDVDTRHNLRGVPLSGARLRGAALPFSDLHLADLSGANLSQASLRHAAFEGANLSRADLTEVDLSDTLLGEADLSGALLEDAKLEHASLRFADLTEAVLESAVLRDADFWGAKLEGAELARAQARGAKFGEAQAIGARFDGADLRDADFTSAMLGDAAFRQADLRGAVFKGADLTGADLSGARLQGVDLGACKLVGARWDGALLDHTRMTQAQVGRVGEEAANDPAAAARAYLALERNFTELGDTSASSWAYLRRRRMQKLAARAEGQLAVKERRPAAAMGGYATFVGDTVVEWMCNYGESLLRVFVAIAAVYVGFAVLYGLIGGVERITLVPGGQTSRVTRNTLDLATFSLMAMTTSGNASNVLMPITLPVALLSGVQALIGIFLTGLLGFVAGHRIRR